MAPKGSLPVRIPALVVASLVILSACSTGSNGGAGRVRDGSVDGTSSDSGGSSSGATGGAPGSGGSSTGGSAPSTGGGTSAGGAPSGVGGTTGGRGGANSGTGGVSPACAPADSHGFFPSCGPCLDPSNCDTIDVNGASFMACGCASSSDCPCAFTCGCYDIAPGIRTCGVCIR